MPVEDCACRNNCKARINEVTDEIICKRYIKNCLGNACEECDIIVMTCFDNPNSVKKETW